MKYGEGGPRMDPALEEYEKKKVPLGPPISFAEYRAEYQTTVELWRQYSLRRKRPEDASVTEFYEPSFEDFLGCLEVLDTLKEKTEPIHLEDLRSLSSFPTVTSFKEASLRYLLEYIGNRKGLSEYQQNLEIVNEIAESGLSFHDNYGITLISPSEDIFPMVDSDLRQESAFGEYRFEPDLINGDWSTPGGMKGSINRQAVIMGQETLEQTQDYSYTRASRLFIRQYEGDSRNTVQIALYGKSAGVAGTSRLVAEYAVRKGLGIHLDHRMKAYHWAGALYLPEK